MTAPTKRPAHRPALEPGQTKAVMPIRFGPEDRENIALARHLFGAANDSAAVRAALKWAVLDAGKRLTKAQRESILAAS